MAFVKLDTGILDSTLWIERECREVFITALLLAEPFETEQEMCQYEVRTLNKTGFIVPPGWYGFVRAAGVGILRRAMVPEQAGFAALEKLGAADPESRSGEFDGRRLVRVDGGFIVLNFMKYRDRDHTAAARSKRYRERQQVLSSRRNATTVTRDSSLADADADADAKASKQKAEARAARGARLPTDWKLPKAWGDWALTEQPTWDAEYTRKVGEMFRDYWTEIPGQKGLKLTWEGTWHNWVKKEGPRANGAGGKGAPWWSSEAGTLAKGKELELEPRAGESAADFRGRINAILAG